jgi:hypothetical protein
VDATSLPSSQERLSAVPFASTPEVLRYVPDKPALVAQLQHGLDLAPLMVAVAALTDMDWSAWDFRNRVYRIHKRTRSYPFVWLENYWKVGEPVELQYFNQGPAHDLAKSLWQSLEERYSGVAVKAMLALLPAGCEIPAHEDTFDSLVYVHRCHLPLRTHEAVELSVGGTVHYLREANWYEINNQATHQVNNKSDVDRIHLIVDIMPQWFLDSGAAPPAAAT